MAKHLKEFAWSFVRGVLGNHGGRRNLVMLVLLLVSTWLMVDIYHFNTVTEIPLSVIDLDQSSISRSIIRNLDASTVLSVSPERPESLDEARRMMVDGRTAGVVLIPDGLSADIKRGRQAEVVVAVDNSNILIGKNASNAIAVVMGTVNAGIRVRTLQKQGDSFDGALARVVPLVSDDNYIFNAAKSYSTYLVPGLMLFFLQVYMILLISAVIRADMRNTLKVPAFLGLVVHGTLLGLLFLYGYMPRQGLTVHSPVGVIATVLAVNFASLAMLGIGVKKVFRGETFSMQVSVFLGMLSLMFSGITWPTDSFPLVIRVLAWLLPFTPMAGAMRILIHFPAGFADIAGPLVFSAAQVGFYMVVISLVLVIEAIVGKARRRPMPAATEVEP